LLRGETVDCVSILVGDEREKYKGSQGRRRQKRRRDGGGTGKSLISKSAFCAFNETLLVYRSHVTQVPSPSRFLGRVCSKCKGFRGPWEGRRGNWNVVASSSGGLLGEMLSCRWL